MEIYMFHSCDPTIVEMPYVYTLAYAKDALRTFTANVKINIFILRREFIADKP